MDSWPGSRPWPRPRDLLKPPRLVLVKSGRALTGSASTPTLTLDQPSIESEINNYAGPSIMIGVCPTR